MENGEIARVLGEIADLLEVKGEDRFRIRSYRNASVVVEGLPMSLKALLEKGEKNLEGIPGIGAGIRGKIIELLATGRCEFHEGLLKEMPQGMLDILKVSGIGPKKAALFYKELGIGSIDALEKAAAGRLIRGLPGMGEKTEEKILRAIKDLKSVSGRSKVSTALQYADSYVDYIKKTPGVIEAVPAGSLRRWKETIGDVDILTSCSDPEAVMERFVKHKDVREVVARGETKSTVILHSGLQVDIRVIDKKAFGAALQYFTGSKAHNVALRDRARRMGLKINEYGVFIEKDKDGEKWAGGRTEEEVYRLVGLAWIPPELRENRGEIEAALQGRLPELIEVSDIKGDLHVHTKESDGGYTLAEMSRAAMELGYEYIAVTDHSRAVSVAHGLDEARVLRQLEEIDRFNDGLKKQGEKFRVLKGTEVDIRADGTLDHPAGLLEKLDCVVAAVHSGFSMPEKEMTARIIKALRTGLVHILAHPTGRLIGHRSPYAVDMDEVMSEAKRSGAALEINSYPDRLDLNDAHCRLAKDKGLSVAISTDAHSFGHYENIVYGVHTARRGWIEKADVLNARPLKELLKFLKGR